MLQDKRGLLKMECKEFNKVVVVVKIIGELKQKWIWPMASTHRKERRVSFGVQRYNFPTTLKYEKL